MADPDYVDLTLADFLSRVAEPTPAPGAGASSAMVVALAAGLAAMAAGLSHRQLPDAEALAARAVELQERAKPLARKDAEAYGAVLEARRLPSDDPARPAAVRDALSAATDVPLEIATVGAEVLDIASEVAGRGNPNLKGDAVTGCLLAQAGVRAALVLVQLNLTDPEDPRHVRAAELARSAGTVPD